MPRVGAELRKHALRASLLAWMLTTLLIVNFILEPQAAAAATPMQLHGALQRTNEHAGIVSHRGAAALAPENTLAAFRLAVAQGTDFVETDLQLTADGVPVLMHDATVDRTTNGRGEISELTLEDVRSLDAGSWFGEAFAGEQVPTFEEFLEVLNPAPTRAFVELKGVWGDEHVATMIEMLRSQHHVHRVVLASFERETLESVRALAPEYATILLTRELDQETVDYAINLRVSAICARSELLESHAPQLDVLRAAGIGTIAYTLNSDDEWQKAAAMGIDFYVTDDPIALAAWRDARPNERPAVTAK